MGAKESAKARVARLLREARRRSKKACKSKDSSHKPVHKGVVGERAVLVVPLGSVLDDFDAVTFGVEKKAEREEGVRQYERREEGRSYDPGADGYVKRGHRPDRAAGRLDMSSGELRLSDPDKPVVLDYAGLEGSAYHAPSVQSKVEAMPILQEGYRPPVQVLASVAGYAESRPSEASPVVSYSSSAASQKSMGGSHGCSRMSRPCGGKYHRMYHGIERHKAAYARAGA